MGRGDPFESDKGMENLLSPVVLIIFSLYSDIMSGYPKYGLTSTQLVLTLTTLTGPGTMQRYSLRVAPIIYNIICFETIL